MTDKEVNEEFEMEIENMNCFHLIDINFSTLNRAYALNNTPYGFVFIYNDFYTSRGWLMLEAMTTSFGQDYDFRDASFEEVFEAVSSDIKEKLVYHLDIFMDQQ